MVVQQRGEKISFKCIFCGVKLNLELGRTSNFLNHLKCQHYDNKKLQKWLKDYAAVKNNPHNQIQLDKETLLLVRLFISWNAAAEGFDCLELREALQHNYKSKIPCAKTFSTVLLEKVYLKIRSEIQKLFDDAISVCIISDIWTNKQSYDFMGIAASIVNSVYEKEVVVIGMELMKGSHCAENIKLAIESVINDYNFDKSIISGCSTDEGSAYVKCMKQITSKDLYTEEQNDDDVLYDSDSDVNG